MKAIVYTKYGPPDVLQFKEVEKSVPKDGEILVKIQTASANPLDWHLMRGAPFLAHLAGGLRKPKDLIYVKELLEVGKVVPMIDRRYALSEVSEALRYLEEGHARGKVVITVDHNHHT